MRDQQEDGATIPELENEPIIFDDLSQYWVAFNELLSSRSSSLSEGYIHYSEIRGYLDEHHIFDLEDRLEYIHWIQFLDHEDLKLRHPPETPKS